MKCVMCKRGTPNQEPGSWRLNEVPRRWSFKNVPAEVCENCGEAYLDAETTQR
jgi:hypothetical protein